MLMMDMCCGSSYVNPLQGFLKRQIHLMTGPLNYLGMAWALNNDCSLEFSKLTLLRELNRLFPMKNLLQVSQGPQLPNISGLFIIEENFSRIPLTSLLRILSNLSFPLPSHPQKSITHQIPNLNISLFGHHLLSSQLTFSRFPTTLP